MSGSDRSGNAASEKLAQQQNAQNQAGAGNGAANEGKTNPGINKSGAPQISNSAAVETVTANPASQDEQQRAQADLQAQQDMAFYALLMLVATIATVVITGIGVWFVKRTLDATLKAVEDTSEATEAMREANSIARHSSENQLRAWLGWDEQIFQFAHDDNDIFLGLHLLGHFKNTGATPALECQIAMAFSLTGEREIDVEKVRTAPNQKIVVAPNMFLASSAMPLNPQQIFDARERPITIRWKLTYQTYFGKEAFTDILAEMRFIGNYDPQVDARHISPGSFRMRFIGESTMT